MGCGRDVHRHHPVTRLLLAFRPECVDPTLRSKRNEASQVRPRCHAIPQGLVSFHTWKWSLHLWRMVDLRVIATGSPAVSKFCKGMSVGERDAKSAKRGPLIRLNISPLYSGHEVERFGERGRLENRTTAICRGRSREVIAQMSAKRALMRSARGRGEPLVGEGWLGNLDSNQDSRSQSPMFYR